MASYTTNLNLEMPTVDEKYDVLKVNQNWQKIDDGYGTLNNQIATLIKSKTYTGTTNTNGLIYPNNIPSGAYLLDAYTDYGTTALLRFGTGGFRAYNMANGAFTILANTEITITYYYFG